MTLEEYTQAAQDLRANIADEGKVTALLANMVEAFGAVVAESAAKDKTVSELTEKNKSLLESNMELFLKVGGKAPEKTEPKLETEMPELKFEDLFNEKGGLK